MAFAPMISDCKRSPSSLKANLDLNGTSETACMRPSLLHMALRQPFQVVLDDMNDFESDL